MNELSKPNPAAALGWLFFRCLRWVLWLCAIGYYIEFYLHRRDHLNSFGHLLHSTEFWIFSLPIGAVCAGFFELMMREKAGYDRPPFGRNWLGGELRQHPP